MALVCLLSGPLKSWGMDCGHVEGQYGGMFVQFSFFFQGIKRVGWFTGMLAFMLSVAMEKAVNHLSYWIKRMLLQLFNKEIMCLRCDLVLNLCGDGNFVAEFSAPPNRTCSLYLVYKCWCLAHLWIRGEIKGVKAG